MHQKLLRQILKHLRSHHRPASNLNSVQSETTLEDSGCGIFLDALEQKVYEKEQMVLAHAQEEEAKDQEIAAALEAWLNCLEEQPQP